MLNIVKKTLMGAVKALIFVYKLLDGNKTIIGFVVLQFLATQAMIAYKGEVWYAVCNTLAKFWTAGSAVHHAKKGFLTAKKR